MKLKIRKVTTSITLRQNMGGEQLDKVLAYVWRHFFGTHTLSEAVYKMLESNAQYLGYGAWALHEAWRGRSWHLTFTGCTAYVTPIGFTSNTDDRPGQHVIKLK